MEYHFREIENKWRKFWAENQVFKAEDYSEKEKFYVLDMFPYPSGAGLHVGHPLGYIASDIFARYKRLQGFNVLHPMGYDSFGLPAEQYAIQTGQHPEKTTRENILRYRDQLDKIGFSFDWSREVRTSDPSYYKWTQWIFMELFACWYNNDTQQAEPLSALIQRFEQEGNKTVNACSDCEESFDAASWKQFNEAKKEAVLQTYRLAYLADSWVNWCPALGTVLANDEVVNGVSERGGHPVEQKLMRQWSMRIKAYAERLLQGLESVDWTESIKDMQRNWIGKSQGCSVKFKLADSSHDIEVFTTRPDTIFGVTFLVLAPEHPLVGELTTDTCREAVEAYVKASSLKTERDRQSNVKNISGEFIGSYAIHPFTGEKIALWIGDYVLASYGTGAVMAVPCGDQRDWEFAKHFDLEIKNIFENIDISEAAYSEKEGTIANSGFLSGLPIKKAMATAIQRIETDGIGTGKTNYRLRDAVFSRQRYWGEPFPVYYKNGLPCVIDVAHLPIVLPEVEQYLPTPDGQPPLGNATHWAWDTQANKVVSNDKIDHQTVFPMELNTMPGWAGSSWYFLRYMDANNQEEFVSKEKAAYWKNVDLYIGGAEHATGHLLYARFWTKFLKDRGYIEFDEPFQKMINQGMILGRSNIMYKIPTLVYSTNDKTNEKKSLSHSIVPPIFISNNKRLIIEEYEKFNKIGELEEHEIELIDKHDEIRNEIETVLNGLTRKINEYNESHGMIRLGSQIGGKIYLNPSNVDISIVENDKLDIQAFKNSREEYKNALFICEENGDYICGHEVEKMSKSKFNVQTPDELVEKFGADTLRMYEMFLGPLEQSKPWDTQGISGVHNFLRKLWRLFRFNEAGVAQFSSDAPSKDTLRTLHKTIQKIGMDLDRFSFNTGVSNFMICVNELSEQKCSNKEVLRDLVILLSPYAPHIAEELWTKLGEKPGSISVAAFPKFNAEYLVSDEVSYPVSFNGKVRFKVDLAANLNAQQIESHVMGMPEMEKWLEGKTPKKMIVVPGRIVNVVV